MVSIVYYAIQILQVLLNCLGFPAYMVKFVLKYCAEKELLNLLLAQNTIMYTHANNLTIYACR